MEIRQLAGTRPATPSSASWRASRRATGPSSRRTSRTPACSTRGRARARLGPSPSRTARSSATSAVVPLHGWSSHVGEVRVIVDPGRRGRGVGRALARRAILEALELGLTKMVVEVIADQEPTIACSASLGFDPEALLADHVRDRSGELRDLDGPGALRRRGSGRFDGRRRELR